MSLTVNLRNILEGGREFAGVWNDFIRIKDKDGIYRLYKEVNGELQFFGAAKTTTKTKGGNVIRSREKFYPTNDNCSRNTFVTREYSSNGKKLNSEYQEDKYRISDDLNIRDNDISNIDNLDKTPGIYHIKSKSVYKDSMGTLPYGYNTPDGYKIAGTEIKGMPAEKLEERYLTPEELLTYNSWL